MTPNLLDELEGVVKFLLGEGELNGRWFGDEPPVTASGLKRRYWWRDDLRKAHAALADMAKRLEAAERDAARYAFLKSRAYIGVNVHKECLWTLRRIPEVIGTFDDDVDAAIDATQEGEAS